MNFPFFHEVDVVGILFECLLRIGLHFNRNLSSLDCWFISYALAFSLIFLIELGIDVNCMAFLLGLSSLEVNFDKIIKDGSYSHHGNVSDNNKKRFVGWAIAYNWSNKESAEKGEKHCSTI